MGIVTAELYQQVYAKVSWEIPTSSGDPITGYEVEYDGKTVSVDSETTSLIARDVAIGTEYEFTVSATSDSGNGASKVSKPVTPVDDFCRIASQKYFCNADCSAYYYCNGGQKSDDFDDTFSIPDGYVCNAFGGFDLCDTTTLPGIDSDTQCPYGGTYWQQDDDGEPFCTCNYGAEQQGEGSCWYTAGVDIDDPCADVDCNGHGVCSDGICTCDEGYIDDNCDKLPPTDNSTYVDVCKAYVNLVIVMDDSSSIGDVSLPFAIQFTRGLMSSFIFDEKYVMLGINTFNEESEVKVPFSGDLRDIIQGEPSIDHSGVETIRWHTWTNTFDGMSVAESEFLAKMGDFSTGTQGDDDAPLTRDDYTSVLILITDGMPTVGCTDYTSTETGDHWSCDQYTEDDELCHTECVKAMVDEKIKSVYPIHPSDPDDDDDHHNELHIFSVYVTGGAGDETTQAMLKHISSNTDVDTGDYVDEGYYQEVNDYSSLADLESYFRTWLCQLPAAPTQAPTPGLTSSPTPSPTPSILAYDEVCCPFTKNVTVSGNVDGHSELACRFNMTAAESDLVPDLVRGVWDDDAGSWMCEAPSWNCTTLCDDSNGDDCGPWVIQLDVATNCAPADSDCSDPGVKWSQTSDDLKHGNCDLCFTYYYDDSDPNCVYIAPPPVVWPFVIIAVVGLLLAAGAAVCVYTAANAAMAMPTLYSINEPPPAAVPPTTKKKHWNVSASNYLGAAGPLAVRWGKYGEGVEGERAMDSNPNTMDQALLGDTERPNAHQLELEQPTSAPSGKPGGPCWMPWLFFVGVALFITGIVLWATA